MVKKLLAVVLAAMMMCGVLAVGASAVPIAAQGTFEEDFAAFKQEAEDNATLRVWISPTIVYEIFADREYAFKDGKTKKGLSEAEDKLMAEAKDSAECKALQTFLDNEDALRAAHADGTLKDKLFALYKAFYDVYIDEVDALAIEYFRPDALAYATEYSKFNALAFVFDCADLAPEKRAEIKEKFNNYAAWSTRNALDEGNLEEALRIVKAATKEFEKILAEYGIITLSNPDPDPDPDPDPNPNDDKPDPKPEPDPEPTFIAKVWNFILKWFLFGWLWMKK